MMVYILGNRGHGKSIGAALSAMGECEFTMLDVDTSRLSGILDDLRSGSGSSELKMILGIGDIAKRRDVVEYLDQISQKRYTVIHPSAYVDKNAEVDYGVFVGAKAYIGPGAIVGKDTIINSGAVIEHDCKIGSLCHIAPNATCCGYVTIGDQTLLGAGSTVVPYTYVSNECLVAAGAVVVKDITDARSRVMGVPAKTR